MKEAADLLRARPILSSLLGSDLVNEDEKNAILDYLGGVETLSEESLAEASKLADNEEAVFRALLDILQKHDVKPEEELPAQPINEPQDRATGGTVKDVIADMIGV